MLKFARATGALGCLALLSCVSGCSGTDADEQERMDSGPPQTDAGAELEDSGAPSGLDAGHDDAGPTRSDGGVDAGHDDAGHDASTPPLDAGSDASAEDAGADAGPAGNVVYASFNGVLVRIDPDTAALTEIGNVRNAANEQTIYKDLVLARSNTPNTALMITSYYQTPTLASLDLCTGVATLGPTLKRTNPNNLVVEGLAVHPNGTVYVASGNPPSPSTQPYSNYLGTLDLETGNITDLSTTTIDSGQDDTDMLFVRDDTLYGVDVLTANNRLDLFTLNLTTGAASIVASPTYGGSTTVPLRIDYDASRQKAFSWRPSDRNLLEINLTTGAATALGATHANTAYASQPSRGFFVAPRANCDQ
jgi:hypothetical protein